MNWKVKSKQLNVSNEASVIMEKNSHFRITVKLTTDSHIIFSSLATKGFLIKLPEITTNERYCTKYYLSYFYCDPLTVSYTLWPCRGSDTMMLLLRHMDLLNHRGPKTLNVAMRLGGLYVVGLPTRGNQDVS